MPKSVSHKPKLLSVAHLKCRSDDRGFALVSVLWWMIILSLIAAGMLHLGRISTHLGHNALQHAKMEMAIQVALDRAILGLTDSRAQKRWRVDNVPFDFMFMDMPVTVAIQDELGKIDINAADNNLLKNLFTSLKLTPETAATMADRILDWRSDSVLQHLNGAEDQDYSFAGNVYRPRHGPFQSIDELQMVLGMTPALYLHVQPAVTVYSQHQQVDPSMAPREVLLALPGMDENAVQKLLQDRSNPINGSGNPLTAVPAGVIDPVIPLTGRAFTIRAEIRLGQQHVVHEKIIRITGDPARPFLTLAWK